MNYYDFLKKYWHVCEPSHSFRDNWHIKLLCDTLQADIERVGLGLSGGNTVLRISPRSMKSYIFNVMLVAWAWTKYPHLKFLMVSWDENLANELAVRARLIIQSPVYQEQYGNCFKLCANGKSRFSNDKGGERIATWLGTGLTAITVDVVIGDNVIKPQDEKIQQAQDWIDCVLKPRVSHSGVMWLIEDKRIKAKGFRKIVIPAIYDSKVTKLPYGITNYCKDGDGYWDYRNDDIVGTQRRLGRSFDWLYQMKPKKRS